MKCPYCTHEFPLTWARYFRAVFGRHSCPSCNKVSKLAMTRQYVATLVVNVVPLQLVVTVGLLYLYKGWWGAIAIGAAIGLAYGILLDRYVDEHRELIAMEPNAPDFEVAPPEGGRHDP